MPSPVLSQRRAAPLPAEQRRATIIEAVLPLLSDYGDGVTTRQIAHAAGVAEGTIFNVFADKDELIAAAIEVGTDTQPLDEAIAAIDEGWSFERRLIEATSLSQQRIVEVWRLVSKLSNHRPDRRPKPLADIASLIELFESERDHVRVEPVAAARTLRSLTLAMTHPLMVEHPATPEQIVELLLHGIEARR